MQFCTNCGASIEQPSASAVQAKTGAKKKGVVITLCIVLALAVIGAGVFFVLRLLNPVSRVMSALESGDYTKALSIYEDKVEGDRKKGQHAERRCCGLSGEVPE